MTPSGKSGTRKNLRGKRPGAIKEFSDYLDDVVARGDKTELEDLSITLASHIGADVKEVEPLTRALARRQEDLRAKLERDLHDLGKKNNCHIEARLPYLSIGCVRFHGDVKKGSWTVSVLDSEPIDRIQTVSPRVLFQRALQEIEDIETALEQADRFIQVLKTIKQAFKLGGEERIPANVLMLLCSHGRALRKALVLGVDAEQIAGCTRAQFGFLMRRAIDSPSSKNDSYFVRFQRATQHEDKGSMFVPIPDLSDPRQGPEYKPVVAMTLHL